MKKFGKKLSPKQTQVVLSAFSSATPTPKGVKDILTLKSLLTELVVFGSHEKLDERIAYYCEDCLTHFYDRMLERLEDDFGQEAVRTILGLLVYSRTGLSEPEILDISNATILQWSSIRYSISHLLTLRNGKYYIDKFTIATKIVKRYGSTEKSFRHALYAYFSHLQDARAIEEFLFQSYHLRNYDILYKTLLNIDVMSYLYENDIAELIPSS